MVVRKRRRSTDVHGAAFSPEVIDAVWSKGRIVPDRDPSVWRYDFCGLLIKRAEFGKTLSVHGWEIDHILPVSKGGTDELNNLQPLQWDSNRRKGDAYPWNCS